MDDTGRRAGFCVITRGTRIGASVRSVFGSLCVGKCDVVYASYFFVEERQIISTFVEISLSSLVRNVKVSLLDQTSRSLRAKLNGIALLVCPG